MSENEPDSAKVVLAEDEEGLAELYEAWLRENYEVRTANGGQEALNTIDQSVDVVLLDRRMPDKSGDEVLADLRASGFDQPIAMVSAVEPDLDLLEMHCSDYLSKPVSKEGLRTTVNRMETLMRQDPDIREYYELMAKKSALDASQSAREIAESEAYAALESNIATLRDRVDIDEGLPAKLQSGLNRS